MKLLLTIAALTLFFSVSSSNVSANWERGDCFPNAKATNFTYALTGQGVQLSWEHPLDPMGSGNVCNPAEEDLAYHIVRKHKIDGVWSDGYEALAQVPYSDAPTYLDENIARTPGNEYRYLVRYNNANSPSPITVAFAHALPERPLSTIIGGGIIDINPVLSEPPDRGNAKTWRQGIRDAFKVPFADYECPDANGQPAICNCSTTHPDLAVKNHAYSISEQNNSLFDASQMTDKRYRNLWKGYTMHHHKWHSTERHEYQTSNYQTVSVPICRRPAHTERF